MTASQKQGLRYLAVAVGVLALFSAVLWLGGSVKARGASQLTSESAAPNRAGVEFTAPELDLFAPNPFDFNYQKHFTEHVHIRRKTGPNGKNYQYVSKWYVLYGKKYWKPFVIEYDDAGRLVSTYWGRPVRSGVCPQCGYPCASVKFHPELWHVQRTETIYAKANVAPPKYDDKYELDFMSAYNNKFWRVKYREYLFYHQKWNHVRTTYGEVYLMPNGKGESPVVNPLIYVNWDVDRPVASTGGWRYQDWPAELANGGTLKAMGSTSVPDAEEMMREFARYGKVGGPGISAEGATETSP